MNEKILVVDDEKEIADLLEVYLKNDNYIVHKYYNGIEALECIQKTEIDLAILDVMLPDIDGFRICQKIRENYYFPVIMLTAKIDDGDKIMGLTIGADDYITKPFNPLEVIARVKTQLRRYQKYNNPTKKQFFPKSEYDIRGLIINKDTHKCFLFGKEISLTPIEFSILWYLCEHQGKVVSTEELFENIWKEKYLDNNNTVKSLILVDLSNDNIFISKRENEQQLPASLAKLFVIEYAATLADLDSIVPANYEAIQLTKPGSSVANIDAKKYFLHNLFAAMLVPSGNDAAYVVADYCGSILSPQAKNSQERINVFMEHLNNYLQNQGYENTILYDPSGYDVNALTTVSDLKSVSTHLLEKQWFRDIVSKSNYTATLPDGSTQTWRNTNTFLDQTSEYYNENVKGIKTGSLSNDYNLVVLYQQHGKEFLICSLGSQSDSSRYDDVNYILKTIDESDYLTK